MLFDGHACRWYRARAGRRVAADAAGRPGLRPLPAACGAGVVRDGFRRGLPGELRQPDFADRSDCSRRRARCCAPGERIVLGPAEDGGYYLLGMKQPHRASVRRHRLEHEQRRSSDAGKGGGARPRGGHTAHVVRRGRRAPRCIVSPPGRTVAYAAPATNAWIERNRIARTPEHSPRNDRSGASPHPCWRSSARCLLCWSRADWRCSTGSRSAWPMRPALAEFVASLCVAGALWLLAVVVVRRGRLPPRPIWLVLGVAVAMRLLTLQCAAGAVVGHLSLCLGRPCAARRHQPVSLPAGRRRSSPSCATTAVYPHINRADYAPTVYPPAAQAIFALAAVCDARRVRHEADDRGVRCAGDRRADRCCCASPDAIRRNC